MKTFGDLTMRLHSWAWQLSGGLFFLGVWHFLASGSGSLAFASPWETLAAAAGILTEKNFWFSGMLPTLCRVLVGFVLGIIVGGGFGVCAGLFPGIALFLLPFRWILSSVPGVVLVILAMLWCGVGSTMVVVIVALTVTPTIYLAMQEGIATTDSNLCEMARVYKLSCRKRLTEIYLPSVSASLISACVIALGGGMRVAILGETLGMSQGLGYTLAMARANLDTAGLYAVALLSMLLVSVIEATFLRFIRKRVQRSEGI
ncbi:ABC transporter permease subunit [Vibrio mimicus]